MDSSAKILAKRYARAYMGLDGKVFGSSLEKASLEKLEGLRRVFEAARPNLKVLTHPVINSSVKAEVLGGILGELNKGPAAEFAALLVKRGRFNLLEEIMQECLRLNDDFCGLLRAEVYSRYTLSEGEMRRITDLLTSASGKKIALRSVIAERVMGGFEIKLGDTIIDATVRRKLEALRAGLTGKI